MPPAPSGPPPWPKHLLQPAGLPAVIVDRLAQNPDDIQRRGHVPLAEVLDELARADGLYPRPFVNYAEGIETVSEEVRELKNAVRVNPKNRDHAEIRKEAIQAAAMLLRFLRDCCPKE